MMKKILLFFVCLASSLSIFAQNDQNSASLPKKYIIGAIHVEGNENIDPALVIAFSGLSVGNELFIPGDRLGIAIRNLWKQKLFSDINILADSMTEDIIYLTIKVQSAPRLSKYTFTGISKSEAKKIEDKLTIVKGEIVTDYLIQTLYNKVNEFYVEKGYLKPEIKIIPEPDTLFNNNSIKLTVNVNKNEKVKIGYIGIEGNNAVKTSKIKSLMKKTKMFKGWNFYYSFKFLAEKYEEDKNRVIAYYNKHGYRDAKIEYDTVLIGADNKLTVNIKINEGRKYYFRNIYWTGNTKYSDEELNAILGIKKGDVYNPEVLSQKLNMNPAGLDVSSLYMDNGYLFFNINPVEVKVENDSIDIEIRIFEGPPATVSKVLISGNTRTSDHVIMREIRTRPGMKFSRSDIIRTQRELANLGYFDPEQMNVIPTPDPEKGTVDLEYILVEKPSDQFQLQGGWGAGQFVGSLGFMFSNFSSRKFFKFKEWQPLPSGDGQRLSLRFQSNAIYFSSFNLSFTEPWLGGKKPNSLSISFYRSFQSNGKKKTDPLRSSINIAGVTVGLGQRLRFPDDYFTTYNSLTFQRYDLSNYTYEFSFANGYSNNLNFRHLISRNSVDQPIYPRRGSNFSLSLQWTPPYSLFTNKDWSNATLQEKYKWSEYHKWRFDASWFLNIVQNLVLNARMQYGFIGFFNPKVGLTPFERFYVGGSGLTGFHLDGRELIALRGYEDNSLTAQNATEKGGTIFNKYTLELRYPLTLNQSATIYALVFAEAGNSWLRFKEFNPFKVYRSLGAGIRIFMPMFGLLGFDWGYGFDAVPGSPEANKSQFHISIGQEF
ncbi:MAG: outer membrane protein assembly factor BamA [Sphingobacteriales bacterium]|nr:outer membrane protein assembly factor BamA [Sphingobacteriales bacterium]